MVLKYNDSEASALIRTIAGNLPGYGDVAPVVQLGAVLSTALTSERLRIEDIAHPPPRAYYLRPGGAPGCTDFIQEPKCATMFEAEYRAIISLPQEASLLQDAWATCNPAIYGVYDPPIALTQAQTADSITAPAYEPSTASYTAEPVTLAPPLATPGVALEAELPPQTSVGSTSKQAIRPSFPDLSGKTSSHSTSTVPNTRTSTSSEGQSESSAAPTAPTTGSAARAEVLSIPWSCLGIGAVMLNLWAI
jgi:hypothetical protein